MRKIGIDARLYSQTGVGTYLQNLLFNLDKKDVKDNIYFVYFTKNDAEKIKFKSDRIVKKIANQKWHSFFEQTSFLYQLIKDDLDLMHFTYFSYPILYWRDFIATVHDTTPLQFKTGKASTKNQLVYRFKHLVFKLVLWLQVHKAKTIITPTNTVKEELIKIYGNIISSKTIPIYEGINQKIIKGKENKNLAKKYQDFFIYVGNFYPHKNVEKLIDAFAKINGNYKLILIGPEDYFAEKILHYINIMESKNKIIFIKNPSVTDLVFFYKNAMAIIHPSLSEGFGLPLVESAYFGTPIIASNIAVFKELWDDRYISFDPYDANDISDKINKFIIKKPRFDYKQYIEKYSFEKMTEETLKIYQSVTQNS